MLFLEKAAGLNSKIDYLISSVVNILKFLYNVILVAVPIVMLILGTIDLVKAIAGGDEKDIKSAVSLLGKRMLYGVGTFLVMVIVQTVIIWVDGDSDWSLFWGGSPGESRKLTISCPEEFVIELGKAYPFTSAYPVGTITTNEPFERFEVSEGFTLIDVMPSSATVVTTNKFNPNLKQVRIIVQNSEEEYADCKVVLKFSGN